MPRYYTTAELVREAGVTYRTLRRWVVAGLLPQPVLTSTGHGAELGVQALWHPAAMRRVKAIRAMRRAGAPMSDIRKRWRGVGSDTDSEGGIPPVSPATPTS